MLKSLKEKCECAIPSLESPSSSFDFKMVSLSWYCTEDLKIEMSQPKEFIIPVLKSGWNSMHFYILSRDYSNTALSGDSQTGKYETKTQLLGKPVYIPVLGAVFYNSCRSVVMPEVVVLPDLWEIQQSTNSTCVTSLNTFFSAAAVPQLLFLWRLWKCCCCGGWIKSSPENTDILSGSQRRGWGGFPLQEQKSKAGSWVHWTVLKKN